MSYPPLPGLAYGPPAKLNYSTPEYDIVCVWGYSTWDTFHHCSVRNIPVAVFGATIVSDANKCYRKCMFPDGRVMLVNEGTIRVTRIKNHGHPIK